MRFDQLKRWEFITLLGGAVATTLLRKVVLAADSFIFEIISVEAGLDQRTGRPIVSVRLKDQEPFTRFEAEKQVLRTMELRVDGTAIFKAVVREPPYVGALQISGSTIDEMLELQARISRAVEAGGRLELAIVD
jgi:preprotein translocase subunit SecD